MLLKNPHIWSIGLICRIKPGFEENYIKNVDKHGLTSALKDGSVVFVMQLTVTSDNESLVNCKSVFNEQGVMIPVKFLERSYRFVIV